jgi:hypothetical protein
MAAWTERVERQSLFVLSHLELQNTNRDLIFSTYGMERLNACLAEMKGVKQHERLFVWEPEVSEKKKESHTQFILIFALALFLALAKYFRLE